MSSYFFSPSLVLIRSQLLILLYWRSLYVLNYLHCAALKIFSLFFSLNLFTIVSGYGSFAFILFKVCWDSCVDENFCQIWKDFIHYFFNIFSAAFSVSSPPDVTLLFNGVPHFTEVLLFLFNLFSVWSLYCLIVVNLSSSLLTPFLAQIYSWYLLIHFLFTLLYFSTLEFTFGYFL